MGIKPFRGMVDFSIPKGDTGTLWTPGPNFPYVDIILTPNSLFQITISQNHLVEKEPLQKILKKLPAKEKISLYFVVPEEYFESFEFQHYLNKDGKVSKDLPKSVQMLKQWVLGLPLTRSLSDQENAEQSEVRSMKERAVNKNDTQQSQTSKKRAENEDGMQQPWTSNKRRAKLNVRA